MTRHLRSPIQVQRVFVEQHINGVPVVDRNGKTRGLTSSLDLLTDEVEDHRDVLPLRFRRQYLEDEQGDLAPDQGDEDES